MEETLKVAELIATQYATVTQSFYGFDHIPFFQQFHLLVDLILRQFVIDRFQSTLLLI